MSYEDFVELDKNNPTIPGQKFGSDDISRWFKIINGKVVLNAKPRILSPFWWLGAPIFHKIAITPSPPEENELLLYSHATTGNLTVQKTSGLEIDLEEKYDQLSELIDIQLGSLSNNQQLKYDSTSGKWINFTPSYQAQPTTLSNVGSAGIGIYKQRVGDDCEIKKVNAASSKLSITDDTGNSKIDFDVSEAGLSRVGNLSGIIRGNGSSPFTAIGLGNPGEVLTNVAGTPQFAAPGAATAREDIAAHWSEVMRKNSSTTYANMKFIYDNDIETTNQVLDDAVMNCDFTAKTQFRVQFAIRRDESVQHGSPGSSVDDIKVVDSTNASNVLFEKTSISTDTRQTVALTSLPAWATGAKTLVPMAKQESGSGCSIWLGDLIIWLK